MHTIKRFASKALVVLTISAAVLMVSSPPAAKAQAWSDIDRLKNPSNTLIASNSTTAQVDFSDRGTDQIYVTDLSAALVLYPTNLVAGRTREIFIDCDGTARNISVVTNGLTRTTEILWDFASVTNGATSFSCTNRAMIILKADPGLRYIWARWRQAR